MILKIRFLIRFSKIINFLTYRPTNVYHVYFHRYLYPINKRFNFETVIIGKSMNIASRKCILCMGFVQLYPANNRISYSYAQFTAAHKNRSVGYIAGGPRKIKSGLDLGLD